MAAILLVEWLTCDFWPKNPTVCAPFLWLNGWLAFYRKEFQTVCALLLVDWLTLDFVYEDQAWYCLYALSVVTGWLWIVEKFKGKIPINAMWGIQYDKYYVTNAMWQLQCDKCNMINDQCNPTTAMWQMYCEKSIKTNYILEIECDKWLVTN